MWWTLSTLESVPQLFWVKVSFSRWKIVDIHDDNNNDDGDGHDHVDMNTKRSHHLKIYFMKKVTWNDDLPPTPESLM